MSKKLSFNSPLYITKRMNISKRNAWFIRIGCMLAAFLLSGIICTIIAPGSFGQFYLCLFEGTFSNVSLIFNLLCCVSTYLLLALAVTPAFKMKFWNIGAEGQTLASCIVTAVILLAMPNTVPDSVVILMALVVGIAAGMIWALIPTICKIKFNTNETLFTLMMNYVATAIAGCVIAIFGPDGNGFPLITKTHPLRTIDSIGDVKYIPFIICAVLLTVFMLFYLKKFKHGFELSILGDSRNTARYVGISINKVTMRTMALSGAIAGLVGFLLVCGQHNTLTLTLVGGKGFTSVLIAWLGHFNPAEIGIYSFLIGFLDKGVSYSKKIDPKVNNGFFSGIIIGLFILIVIVSEFFVRYSVKFRDDSKLGNKLKLFFNKINVFKKKRTKKEAK